jgi:Flp pilus assembly protein TadG
MTSAFGRLLTLKRDERAATAVEFAILVTPLMALILGSLQLSMIFYVGQLLQTAAVSASRELMTGADQSSSPAFTKAQYHADVCKFAPLVFDCNSIMVDVESSTSYSSTNTTAVPITYDTSGNPPPPTSSSFAYSPGGPGDVVIVRVMYCWPVIAGPLFPGLANQSNGSHLLVGTSVFKTEPY